MTFFNPKEDVLDVRLTQLGKSKLSDGKLKPSYYLFFDDNILYDQNCAGGPTSGDPIEIQNEIKGRIQNETVSLTTQHNYRPCKENSSYALSSPTLPEWQFSLKSPLGTSDIMSEKFPKWEVEMFGEDCPTFTSSTEYLSSSYGYLRIPQNNISVIYKTAISGEGISPVITEDPHLSSAMQTDGTYISVQPKTILMQIIEKYSDFEKENFDIEVFLDETSVEEDEIWTPLKFKEVAGPAIVDGILVDETPEKCVELDKTYVEYYFDCFVDDSIDSVTMSQVPSSNADQNMYQSTESSNSDTTVASSMADIYSRIVPEDPCPEEECP